jgi:transposase InsO family protein
MSDNAMVYRRARRFQQLLAEHSIQHIRTPIYTPRWNGEVERFIRTLQEEWAYSRTWPSSSARARSLQSFIRYYNRQRPHSSIGDRPPISRVHNLRGQYNGRGSGRCGRGGHLGGVTRDRRGQPDR